MRRSLRTAALTAAAAAAWTAAATAQSPHKTPDPSAKADAGIIALASEGKVIPTFHPGWLLRQLLDEISYSDARGLANARQITDILVNETLPPEVYIRTPSGNGYRFTMPSMADLDTFSREGVRVSVMAGSTALGDVMEAGKALLQISFAVGIIGFATYQAKGRVRLPSRRFRPERSSTRFVDVAGQDAAKAELQEVIKLLRDPAALKAIGARVPRGVLLYGPPGNGKTLLAKAVAAEAGVPFINVSCTGILDPLIGMSSKRMRGVFKQARSFAPCVLFLDEIDVVTAARGGAVSDAGEDRAQILATMLVEIDGLEALDRVVLIGATNRIEVMDHAILRQGRIERHVHVPPPTRAGRRSILELEAKRLRLDATVDMDRMERLTIGFSGADLSGMMNEAALIAIGAGRAEVCMADILSARDKIVLGSAIEGAPLSDQERLVTAWHEAGHVVTSLHADERDRIERATILPRGRTIGHVQRVPDRDRQTTSRSRVLCDMMVAMGGRAAEKMRFPEGEVTTGARSDIAIATAMARDYVMADGMDPEVGMIDLAPVPGRGWPPGGLSDQAGQRVKAVLDEALNQASDVLRAHRDETACIVGALLERETLSGEDIETLVGRFADGLLGAPDDHELDELLQTTSPDQVSDVRPREATWSAGGR